MKKVLIFPYSNQLGTTIPSITLANLLSKNGYKVEFVSRGRYTFVIKEKGYKVHDVPEISYMHYRDYLDINRMDYYNEHLVRAFVDYELDLIEELDPDIVVGHNRPSLFISSQITKKKYVNLTVASLTHYYDQRIYLPENHILNRLVPFVDVNKVLPKSLVKKVYDLTMVGFARGFNKVLKRYGLSEVDSFLDISEADIVLLTETYGLVQLKNLPNNFLFLEQDTSSGFGERPRWKDELKEYKNEGKKIIGISMGTSSFETYPVVLKNLVNYVLENEDLLLVSNHCGLEKEFLSNKGIYIEEFIQPEFLLSVADIIITHGGKNTLNEAIMAKKLIIGIPEQAEQLWNLMYAESLGIAKTLSKFKLRTDKNYLINTVKEFIIKSERDNNRIDEFVESVIVERDVYDHDKNILEAVELLSD